MAGHDRAGRVASIELSLLISMASPWPSSPAATATSAASVAAA
eukprot:CAMPEP_0170186006 /NCGR_PEP_ID=MMETSP0040_2-20121228/38097_1 /TAXON_ID=641309 /ORGANISM="Lotharella oceanica, Strain CCMP622" /LENGTH=42 /DNA_ID= /DNA_START= /DNA_END= /DNA_ORIENTATION=